MARSPALSQYADDEAIRNALQLAERLPPTGRKPSEYLLASAVRELDKRLSDAERWHNSVCGCGAFHEHLAEAQLLVAEGRESA